VKKLLILIGLAVLAGSACREIALPPAGSYSEVLVVTELGDRSEWLAQLRPYIEAEHNYVTSTEQAFKITSIRAADLEDFPVVKNVLLCGVMDSGTRVGQRIMELIGPEGMERVALGKAAVLKKENLPSPGQMTLIVTAPDEAALAEVIAERGPQIEYILEQSCRQRLRRVLLAHPNRKEMDQLNRKYGFAIEVPYLYQLFSDESDPPGIEFLREEPTRSLGIFWADWERQPSLWDYSELFDMRAAYVWERYDHDKMERERVRYSWVKFGPYGAVKMYGYWYNDDAVAGGYFETYFVWDEVSELLWAVDLLTYAPGRKKHPLVRELRAFGETFRYN